MSNLTLFLVGLGVTIPAAAGVVGLVLAAIADGRENDRVQAGVAESRRSR
jgi:hypothetical protein